MKILLDTADLSAIRALIDRFPVAGFTTNPSILAKEGGNVRATLTQMKEWMRGGRMLHVQTTASSAEEIAAQAARMHAFFGEGFYAKIPMTPQGLKATSLCRAQGVKCMVTAIFTPVQALAAALAGADYVAPYVDRLDNICADGAQVVGEIVSLFKTHGLPTQVLAASFKNVQQVQNVALAGAHAATVSAAICEKLLFHPYTDKSVQDFASDWQNAFGQKHITDLLFP